MLEQDHHQNITILAALTHSICRVTHGRTDLADLPRCGVWCRTSGAGLVTCMHRRRNVWFCRMHEVSTLTEGAPPQRVSTLNDQAGVT